MNADVEPQLAPPGAGLPLPELYLGRLFFALKRWTGNRDSFNAQFQRERARIAGLVRACDAASASRRVLIRRPPGLEDSSRYWSVWMTLDHLRIVHRSVISVIGALAKGVTPPGQASTAAVKPDPEITARVVSEYEQSCEDLLATVASVTELKTSARFRHPWFGPLDAAGWHALAAGHLAIHRVQIQRILARLAEARP